MMGNVTAPPFARWLDRVCECWSIDTSCLARWASIRAERLVELKDRFASPTAGEFLLLALAHIQRTGETGPPRLERVMRLHQQLIAQAT
jgi:hypothetical protein